MRVLHPDDSALDADDAIGGVAELENVAGGALDGEVLVDAADRKIVRLQHHLVVGGVGDRAARGQRGQPRAAPAAQHAVDRVVVDQRAAPAAPRREAFGEHMEQRRKILTRQVAIGPGAAHARIERRLRPVLRRHFGDDLLGERVERPFGDRQPIEFAAPHAVEQRRAFHQFVARLREQPPLRQTIDRMPRASDALQEAGDRTRRAELADEIDLADVDAELQRGGRHQRLQRAVLQPLLGAEPMRLGHAAVVGGDLRLAEPLGKVARDALGHPPRVDEDERGAMRLDELREALVDLLPHFRRHHRFERRGRDFQRQVARPVVADVDDRHLGGGAAVRAGADQQTRDRLDRILGRRQADAQQPVAGERRQALQRQRQMGAALVAAPSRGFRRRSPCACVDSIGAAGFRAEQHVERFRRSDENVRRARGASSRARRAACRRCAPACGFRRRAALARARRRGSRRAAPPG